MPAVTQFLMSASTDYSLSRDELQKLRQEESHYLHLVESGKRQLDTLIQNLKIVQSDTNVVSPFEVFNKVYCYFPQTFGPTADSVSCSTESLDRKFGPRFKLTIQTKTYRRNFIRRSPEVWRLMN